MALKAAPAAEKAATEEPAEKKSKKKLLAIAVVAVVAVAAAAWFFLLRGGEAEAVEEPHPGAVLPMEPVTLNLADGHFLKLGLALQLTDTAGGGHGSAPDGSKALDLAIALLSNREVAELSSSEAREKVKAELAHEVEEAYHGDVMDIYFTEFVMQ